jgi:hypothetical protein
MLCNGFVERKVQPCLWQLNAHTHLTQQHTRQAGQHYPEKTTPGIHPKALPIGQQGHKLLSVLSTESCHPWGCMKDC